MLPRLKTLRFLGLFFLVCLIGFVIISIETEQNYTNRHSSFNPSEKIEIASKKPKTWDQLCVNCHSIGGEGGDIGPPLDLISDKFTKEYLITWLKNPDKIRHGTMMPNFELSDMEINEIVTFLSHLKGKSI